MDAATVSIILSFFAVEFIGGRLVTPRYGRATRTEDLRKGAPRQAQDVDADTPRPAAEDIVAPDLVNRTTQCVAPLSPTDTRAATNSTMSKHFESPHPRHTPIVVLNSPKKSTAGVRLQPELAECATKLPWIIESAKKRRTELQLERWADKSRTIRDRERKEITSHEIESAKRDSTCRECTDDDSEYGATGSQNGDDEESEEDEDGEFEVWVIEKRIRFAWGLS